MAGRRCLVLGGGGFLGTNLCHALAGADADVLSFGRRAPEGIPAIVGAMEDHDAVARALAGREIVYHVVGSSLPASSNADPIADIESNVIGMLRLLEQCRQAGVRQFVFASTGGAIYGITPAAPIPETAPTDPISAYGISRLAIEKYLHLNQHLHGLDYRVLRIANPYGPHQSGLKPQGLVAVLLRRALAGETLEIWGDGTVVRDFVHVTDVARAFLHASLYEGPHRVFNVGSGRGLSVNSIVGDIETVLGRSLARTYMPARSADVPVSILDTGMIAREIGWTPCIEWLDGLRSTGDWFRRNGLSQKEN